MNNSVKLESIDGKCENCGNNLKFSPNDGCLKCEKCGSSVHIEETRKNLKQPYGNLNDKELIEWQNTTKHIKCKSCGSTVELNNNEISIDCPYCNSQNLVLEKDIKGLYPNFLVKFAFNKEVASEKFKKQAKKKFMAPRRFKKLLPENKIEGFYFPSFSFDADSHSKYKGILYRLEHRGAGKDARTVKVSFPIAGKIDCSHRDVLVESSSRLNQYQLTSLLPYDFNQEVDFKAEYLLGYKVEQYNELFEVAVKRGAELCKEQVKDEILKKYRHDGVTYLNIDSNYFNECYGYCMMPVYTFEFQYKGQKYLAYMNGQTGKLGSGLPVSKVKVFFGVLLGIVVVLLPFILFLFIGGN